MKSIQELKEQYKLFTNQDWLSASIPFLRTHTLDFDVYLPSIGMNLQREYVWSSSQQEQLIHSMIIGRKIPRLAMIHRANDTFEVIDGKQRLMTLLRFLDDKFVIVFDGKPYLYSELPTDYQKQLDRFPLEYARIIEQDNDHLISDQVKIEWFYFLNFSGTAQDEKHMDTLKKATSCVSSL